MRRCDDPGCGLLWLDPAPAEEDLPRAYAGYHTHTASRLRSAWDAALRRWLREGHYAARFGYRVRQGWAKRLLALVLLPNPWIREELDRLIFSLEPRPGGQVLDVGCGSGRSLAELRDLGWQVEGVDFDPEAVAAAAQRGLSVRVGSLEQHRYPPASLDAVLMSHVLEHVADPIGLLAEGRRILRPGGRLLLITPNGASLGHDRFGRDWRGLEPPRHLQVFTRGALAHAAARAGLRTAALRTTAYAAAWIHAESRRGRGDAHPSPYDAESRRFAREERHLLARDPWAGEELWLEATPA
jgi:SAM-dependent methyltransferase